MNYLLRAINRKISSCKKDEFHYNYSMKQSRVYICSLIENEMAHLNDNPGDVLRCSNGFKQNIIKGKIAGTISWMKRVIFPDCLLGFSSAYSRQYEYPPPMYFWTKKSPTNTFIFTI